MNNFFRFQDLFIFEIWIKWVIVAQLCMTLCNLTGCTLLVFFVHGILQAKILEWVAISFSRIWIKHKLLWNELTSLQCWLFSFIKLIYVYLANILHISVKFCLVFPSLIFKNIVEKTSHNWKKNAGPINFLLGLLRWY